MDKTRILPTVGKVYQHRKRGCEYVVLAIAKMESDGATAIVYREIEFPCRTWVRPSSEWWERFMRV